MITDAGGMRSKQIELDVGDILRIDPMTRERAEACVDSIDRIRSASDVVDDGTSGFDRPGSLLAEVDLHAELGHGIDVGNGQGTAIEAQRAVIGVFHAEEDTRPT